MVKCISLNPTCELKGRMRSLVISSISFPTFLAYTEERLPRSLLSFLDSENFTLLVQVVDESTMISSGPVCFT